MLTSRQILPLCHKSWPTEATFYGSMRRRIVLNIHLTGGGLGTTGSAWARWGRSGICWWWGRTCSRRLPRDCIGRGTAGRLGWRGTIIRRWGSSRPWRRTGRCCWQVRPRGFSPRGTRGWPGSGGGRNIHDSLETVWICCLFRRSWPFGWGPGGRIGFCPALALGRRLGSTSGRGLGTWI